MSSVTGLMDVLPVSGVDLAAKWTHQWLYLLFQGSVLAFISLLGCAVAPSVRQLLELKHLRNICLTPGCVGILYSIRAQLQQWRCWISPGAIRERWPWNVALSLRRWRDRRHRWWERKENQIAARPPRSLWEAHEAATVPLTSARSTSTLPSHSQPRSLHLVSVSLFLSPVSVFLWTPSHGLQVHITGMETGNERWLLPEHPWS